MHLPRLTRPFVALLPILVAMHPLPAQPAPAREGTTRLRTGVTLHWVEQGPESGPTVILLHGLSDSWFSFSRVLPLLPPSLHVIALDQRGHGDSERPAAGYAPPSLADDVIAFMDAHGIARAAIVGHSMGSLVAQHVASRAPERVERVVLIASVTAGDRIVGIGELKDAVDALPDPVPLAFTTEFQQGSVHAPVPAAFMARVSEDSRKLPAHAWRAIVDGMLATRPVATDGMRVPVRLFWGDRDAMFTRAEQDALLGAIPGSTLAVFRETGHSPHWERPEQVVAELSAFLTAKR